MQCLQTRSSSSSSSCFCSAAAGSTIAVDGANRSIMDTAVGALDSTPVFGVAPIVMAGAGAADRDASPLTPPVATRRCA